MKTRGVCLIVLSVCAALNGQGFSPPDSLRPDCLTPIGVRQLLQDNPQLTGQRVRVGMVEFCWPFEDCDGQAFLPNFQHHALQQVKRRGIYYYTDPNQPVRYSSHASMIAGILFGHDPAAYYEPVGGSFTYQGIVPQAAAAVYETNWFLWRCILDPWRETVTDDVLTMSWGTDADDLLTMWWQRGIDALVPRQQSVVVAGCGNGENEFTSISKPSWGYNVISVAAARTLGRFPDSLRYVARPSVASSSHGPTDDGRVKPDVMAPGLCLGPRADSSGDYWCDDQSVSYSSFAAPQVAGVAALLIDAARAHQIPLADDPRVIKALILNGADKLAGWHKGRCDPADDHLVPLDYQQGAGLVNALESYQQLMAGRFHPDRLADNRGWDLHSLPAPDDDPADPDGPDAANIYLLPVPLQPGQNFSATLIWYRDYRDWPQYLPCPLQNLMLELWAIDGQDNLLQRLDYSDSPYDNVEHINYYADREQSAALVVTFSEPHPGEPSPVTYALAYGVKDNWAGDLLPGDLSADGVVDGDDLLGWIRTWLTYLKAGSNGVYDQLFVAEDLNNDGLLDEHDLDLIEQHWLQRSPWAQP